jgi:hypothetical protein
MYIPENPKMPQNVEFIRDFADLYAVKYIICELYKNLYKTN